MKTWPKIPIQLKKSDTPFPAAYLRYSKINLQILFLNLQILFPQSLPALWALVCVKVGISQV